MDNDEMLVTGTVTTRHPTDYVLHNELDGTKWRLSQNGHWLAWVPPTGCEHRPALGSGDRYLAPCDECGAA